MTDIETIKRQNAETFAPWIKKLTESGRYVVAVFEGLSMLSVESFEDTDKAFAELHKPLESSNHSRTLYPPKPEGAAGQLYVLPQVAEQKQPDLRQPRVFPQPAVIPFN